MAVLIKEMGDFEEELEEWEFWLTVCHPRFMCEICEQQNWPSPFSACLEIYGRIFWRKIMKKLWECKRAMVHMSIKGKQANLFSFN